MTFWLMTAIIVACLVVCAGFLWLVYRYLRPVVFKVADPAATAKIRGLQAVFLIAFGCLFPVCVILSTLHYLPLFLSPSASAPAAGTITLFNATMAITSVAFFLTQTLLFYFAWRFRKQKNSRASFIKGSNPLELAWTIVPAISFIFLFVWGHLLWTKLIAPASDNALEIEVMGEQFNWKVRYAGLDRKMGRTSFRFINNINSMGIDTTDPFSMDDFIPVQMHIPKGRQVKLILRSKDVIHSFFIPFFGTKMDAVPGMSTTIHFTPLETTREIRLRRNDPEFEFEVACAELCGRMHFAMKLILVVDEPADFDVWFKQQKSWMSKQVESRIN